MTGVTLGRCNTMLSSVYLAHRLVASQAYGSVLVIGSDLVADEEERFSPSPCSVTERLAASSRPSPVTWPSSRQLPCSTRPLSTRPDDSAGGWAAPPSTRLPASAASRPIRSPWSFRRTFLLRSSGGRRPIRVPGRSAIPAERREPGALLQRGDLLRKGARWC